MRESGYQLSPYIKDWNSSVCVCVEECLCSPADTVHRKGTSLFFFAQPTDMLVWCFTVEGSGVGWFPLGEAWTSRGGILSVLLVKEAGEGRWSSLGPRGLPHIMFCRRMWYGTALPVCAQKTVVLSEGPASGFFGAGWLLFGL